MSGIITGFIAIKNSEECKIFLRSKKVANLLRFNFFFINLSLSFQEEPPLPNGRTSLEQHRWHLLTNVFPSQQMCLPGTSTTKHEFYSVTFKCLSFFQQIFPLDYFSLYSRRNIDILSMLWTRYFGGPEPPSPDRWRTRAVSATLLTSCGKK